jgi:maltose/moltooligosaccharide transporter
MRQRQELFRHRVIAFSVGAFVFLLTSILYTIFTTKEDPPADLAQFKLEKKESRFYTRFILKKSLPKPPCFNGVQP